MKRAAQLFSELDEATSTRANEDKLVSYFAEVSDGDKVWMIALLLNHRPPRAVQSRLLGQWATEMAGLPEWLYDESYQVTGDHAETAALIVPGPGQEISRSFSEYMQLLVDLKAKSDTPKKELIFQVWKELGPQARYIFNKLVTGILRISISQQVLIKALAEFTGLQENIIAVRLTRQWSPESIDFRSLILEPMREDILSRPYPFHLAHTLDADPDALGDPGDWIVERRWDGIRGQLIVRDQQLFVWIRGEELVTDKYPEFHPLAHILPSGTVLDGQILAYRDGVPLPLSDIQKRIGRKNLTKKLLSEIPVRMMVFDVLEWQGADIRTWSQQERRTLLESLIEKDSSEILILSVLVGGHSWDAFNVQRLAAREHHSEGLVLKRRDAIYEVGRKRGAWWKWKADPLSVDCVLVYAQRGQGRHAGTLTELTFAVWNEDQLVPFAKASYGLTEKELKELAEWVSANTTERFGPVSIVAPKHVFELHFEGIVRSARHKSGVVLRLPRIHRWRRDMSATDANRLEDLKRWTER